jgi:CHAD domain-containing protein
MGYRLHADESPGAGLLRAVIEQVDEAIAHLTPGGKTPLGVEAVHEARKNMKRVRSGLRLARVAIPEEFRAWNRALAAAARQLAPWRDADALLEAYQHLVEWACEYEGAGLARPAAGATPLFPKLGATLAELPGAGRGRSRARTPQLQRVVKTLRATRAQLVALDATRIDADALARGLRRVRRSCRKAMREALAGQEAEQFHEWRKQAKHFWYATVLLSAVWPAAAAGLSAELKELAGLLGDEHDLVILREWTTTRQAGLLFDGVEGQIAFVMLLDSMQEELRADATKVGRRVAKAGQKGLRKALLRCGRKAAARSATAASGAGPSATA